MKVHLALQRRWARFETRSTQRTKPRDERAQAVPFAAHFFVDLAGTNVLSMEDATRESRARSEKEAAALVPRERQAASLRLMESALPQRGPPFL